MIIVMCPDAEDADIARVVALIRDKGLREHISRGEECTIVGAVGDERVFDTAQMERLPKVQKAIRIVHDWRLVSREAQPADTVLTVRGVRFGGGGTVRVCADADACADDAPAVCLDPFAPSARPYDAEPDCPAPHALRRQIERCRQAGKVVWVRIRDSRHIDIALNAWADVLCLGGELAENRSLLHELGSLNTPVVVYKHSHHTVRDWLVAAEHVVMRGNRHVLLGEAGTFGWHGEPLRLDTDALVKAKKLCHLPVVADLSRLAHRYMDTGTLQALARAAGADVLVY
ncbi:hypothetical protein [Conchiformibius kuhniae]|uniref:3-deoxy-D-arabino-heptulosonate 7-phosphate synthase n=1 Tax=Conchiformibius kuhniae TaxID=211502 RepID=A0A8T9MUL6_9NEIS|nr:hypothetical protein [Conchiformibius kuhniae]UOP04979.1 3-deoxy-D-arabino-heptulosonate 7-phosphate synthase [Conchiformibius kuhniae]